MAIMLRGLGAFDIFDPSTWGDGSGGSAPGTTPPTSDFTGDPNSLPLCPGHALDSDIQAGRVGAQNGWCRNSVGGSAVRYVDPWDPTATGQTFRLRPDGGVPGAPTSGGGSASGIFDWLLGAGAGVAVGATQPAPGTKVTTAVPIAPKPWYRTPLGMIGLGLAAFLGYKWYSNQPKPGA
jgi:hypothetical protein